MKTAAVKTGKQAKVTAKSRGEDALKIDIVANPPGPGGLVTVLTIQNAGDGFTYRTCTHFPNSPDTMKLKTLSDGTGAKAGWPRVV